MKRIGKYEIVRKLGSGATSTVYLALDQFNDQEVALKLFNPAALGDMRANAYRKLLLTEASLAGKLSHPHIVRIYDAVLDGELNYMVMEYVKGDILEKYTDVDRLLPITTVAEIIYKCGNALEYAQQQGVIHRDIKPANILRQTGSEIKIADFGAALIEAQQISQQLTQVAGMGSPAYMSPEQIQELPLTHQTDIYSLGVTMYKLLTGKLPFRADNSYSLLYQIMHNDPPPARSLRPDIPEGLETIVERAMQKNPAQRYQAWADFTHDIASFLGEDTNVQSEIFDTEKFNILRSLSFFRNVGDIELWEVLRISNWRKVGRGVRVLEEGTQGDSLFILARGSVRVMQHGHVLDTLHKGDCFGEMKRLQGSSFSRTTTVVTESNVTLIEINLDVLAKASIECRFQFDDAFLSILLRKLDSANTRISTLLDRQK